MTRVEALFVERLLDLPDLLPVQLRRIDRVLRLLLIVQAILILLLIA